MPFFLLFVWTVISSIIFCQISFAQENLKMIQSTGRAAILEDISKDEARNLALEDALYYAALKGGAQIDGFSHVNSETALEDEFLVRPISKILDYRIIDEVIDDTHYQITIEAAIGEINKNIIQTDFDHRIAMAFAIMGTKIGPLKIKDSDSINTSFPSFITEINELGGKFI